jgi:hypothetical protein
MQEAFLSVGIASEVYVSEINGQGPKVLDAVTTLAV